MLHSFFSSLAGSRYLSFFSISFNFTLWSAGRTKSTIPQFLFLLLIIIFYYYSCEWARVRAYIIYLSNSKWKHNLITCKVKNSIFELRFKLKMDNSQGEN